MEEGWTEEGGVNVAGWTECEGKLQRCSAHKHTNGVKEKLHLHFLPVHFNLTGNKPPVRLLPLQWHKGNYTDALHSHVRPAHSGLAVSHSHTEEQLHTQSLMSCHWWASLSVKGKQRSVGLITVLHKIQHTWPCSRWRRAKSRWMMAVNSINLIRVLQSMLWNTNKKQLVLLYFLQHYS